MESHECKSMINAKGLSFKLMTYNILAYCYVRVPNQPWNAFSYCSDDSLLWSNRVIKLAQKIISSRSDVICLQEVCYEYINDIWTTPLWLQQLAHDL